MSDDSLNEVFTDETDFAPFEQTVPKINLNVVIEVIGPCKKHVRVSVSRASIDDIQAELLKDYCEKAEVPGFRPGAVPRLLVAKRFKSEIAEQAKQRILMTSLEQIAKEVDINPINEPNLDLDSINIPDEGDLVYEFDLYVRPEFDLPNYKGLSIERPNREKIESEVDAYLEQFLENYGKLVLVDSPVEEGDYVTVDITVTYKNKPLTKIEGVSVRVRPILRFQDAEFEGFADLIKGTKAGESRETDLTISMEAGTIAMRGESIHVSFLILEVKRLEIPDLDRELLERVGADSIDELKDEIKRILERQVKYEQRQAVRRLVIEKITESADWELAEDIVNKQIDNALFRELLEMQQAGFTSKEILARENSLRQRSLSITRKNLKEYFVLDRIADAEKVEATPQDFDIAIFSMAIQLGESPRRVRARMIKNGRIENLEAQIRECKAVDVILNNAEYTDAEMPPQVSNEVEPIGYCISEASQNNHLAPEDAMLGDESSLSPKEIEAPYVDRFNFPTDPGELTNRIVPIRTYLSNPSRLETELVSNSLIQLIGELNLEVYEDLPAEVGSWFKRWISRSKDALTHDELLKRLEKAERAIHLKYLDKPQAEADQPRLQGVSELLSAIGENDAIIQIGSILLVKVFRPEGRSSVVVRTLTQTELAYLESHQELLHCPASILTALSRVGNEVDTTIEGPK